MLTADDFQVAGILEHGHFVFASGQHSTDKVEMDHLWRSPQLLRRALEEITTVARDIKADGIMGVPSGGQRLAEYLVEQGHISLPLIKLAKSSDKFFLASPDIDVDSLRSVVVIEDVVTTLGSATKCALCLPDSVRCSLIAIWRRGQVDPLYQKRFDRTDYLVERELPSWPAESCPVCRGKQ